MASRLARVLFFLSSYFPLAVILAIIYWEKQMAVSIVSMALGIGGLVGLLVYFHAFAPKIQTTALRRIQKLKRKDSDNIAYLVSYVVPFLALPNDGWQKQVGLLVFLVVFGVLYVTSSMIHINPMLSAIGFRVYEVTLDDGTEVALLTRDRLKQGDSPSAIEISECVWLEQRRTKAAK